jgi:CelD/BcsL family acetyltransferase involved in cellulose biosynthesis
MNPVLDEPFLKARQSLDSPSRRAASSDAILQHEVFRSFDELRGLSADWDALVEQCDGDLYSSFDWCRIWWNHYGDGRKLEIHIFRADGQIVGLIPSFRETLRIGPVSIQRIRLLGCDHSTTTCGIVVAVAQMDSVIARFSQWLAQDSAWDVVQWSPLAGYFEHREAMADAFARHGVSWCVQSSGEDGPHIIWELPGTFEEYLAGLSKKERSNIKIGRKKLADAEWIGDSATTPEELQRWFPVFIDQHQKQWGAEGKLGHFADWPGAESFHRELAVTMAAQERLWLLRLDVANHPIGFQYNYRFGRRVHWLLGSRDIDPKWDTFGSGRILHAETTERAIGEGFTGIDGLRGMYEYKLRLGGEVVDLQSITLIRRGVWPQLKVRLARLYARWLDLLYYRIWFSRIAPKLPLPRRGLWKLWIRSRI